MNVDGAEEFSVGFKSPLGMMKLTAQVVPADEGEVVLLSAVSFVPGEAIDQHLPEGPGRGVLEEGVRWLTEYFSGREPDFMPPVFIKGTLFQLVVADALRKIPYGTTITYGELAQKVAMRLRSTGESTLNPELIHEATRAAKSARAIGQAVRNNRLCVIVPCHRVIGAHGRLTGYAYGLPIKRALLEIEGVDLRALKKRDD